MNKRAMTAEAKAIKAQSILDMAAEMFASSEYDRIKMSDIAKKMHISNGILFVYFKTKEALFFSLLCREYEKRLGKFADMIQHTSISSFDDFKKLVMEELSELVDQNILYIRLESMRSAILEKNVDAELMLAQKMSLYRQAMHVATLMSQNNILTAGEVMDILQTEASIITGCWFSATLPAAVMDIIEKNELDGFKRDFKKDVLDTMRYYLDGYRMNTGITNE